MLLLKKVLYLITQSCPLWFADGKKAVDKCLKDNEYLRDGEYMGIYQETSECLLNDYGMHCSVDTLRQYHRDCEVSSARNDDCRRSATY